MTLISLNSAGFYAEISTTGAALKLLQFQGRDLIEPAPKVPRYHGSVLAPWPNRIRDGRYVFRGTTYTTVVNEAARGNALHGLVDTVEFSIQSQGEGNLHLSAILPSGNHYPSDIQIDCFYSLDLTGLRWQISAKNIGNSTAPYGVSIHPYLVAGNDLLVDELFLSFESKEFLEVDDQRLLPLELQHVDVRDFNFNNKTRIGTRFIDHAFKVNPLSDNRRIELTDSKGVGTFMEYDSAAHWIQIHTADREGGADSRKCLAVEPMSCPPDAFNSGLDLIELEPGHTFIMSWLIGPIN
jgi:aldose 1-epimerase